MVEASTLRWTFEGGIREAAREALAILWHKASEQMEHSQYLHFSSWAEGGAEAMVLPVGDRDHIGLFTDQVKLTHALVWDLDEVIKEVKLLGEHAEEARQKITKVEALCKRLREDAQNLKEENTKLEGMIKSHDKLIMEIAKEIGLDRMGEDADNKDVNDDDGGDAATPPVVAAPPPSPAPPAVAAPKEIIREEDPMEMVPEQEDPVVHEVILVDAEPVLLQPWLYCALMRD
jgi:hypothetical protein